MSTVELFNFNSKQVRVVPDFKDGQPYFVAKDGKVPDSIPTTVNGFPSKVNRYNCDDITEAAKVLGLSGVVE